MKEVGKNYVLSICIGVVATICCVATLVLLFEASTKGTIILKTSGNPEEVICWFYECIEKGDYESAYTCLAEYSDLGFDNSSEELESLLAINALKNSYKGEVYNDLVVDGLTAKANVRFSYLDLALLQNAIEEGINPVLTKYVNSMTRDKIYDDNGDYSPEFLHMVYDEVLDSVISKNKNIYSTSDYEVDLEYTNDGWKIITNKEMLKGFLGGRNS